MAKRSSSLNNYTGTGITREIDSKYDNIKLVAENILDIDSISAAIADGSLANAINIANMVVSQGLEGTLPVWDGTTLTIPKGDTGASGLDGVDAPTISTIVKTSSNGLTDTYTISLSNLTSYTFEVTNGRTPVKGVDYVDGAEGKSNYDLWLEAGNVGTLGQFLLAMEGEQGVQGIQGNPGIQGLPGNNLTVEQIIYNNDGTFTWQFSDDTSYTTPDLRGPQGAKGDIGTKGDQGISVHHLKGTSTTDPEGDFSTFGELDTYTFYGDAGETLNLGHFTLANGITPDMADGLGLMRRSTYDANSNGIVDNSEALGGKSLVTVENERDAAIAAAQLALGTNYTVADNAARLALTDLTVGDKVFVTNDGDLKWAQYWVTAITDGQGSTSTFEVVMDEDTYLNANTKESIKTTYESNPDTNAYTDAEKAKVGYVSVTQAVDLDVVESDTLLNNTHRVSTGADHTFINQDVTTTGTPRFNSVQLNGGVGDQGLLSWNPDDETVDLVSNGAVIQLGQEVVINARNSTGVTIPDGTPVMVTGTLGNSGILLIAPMDGPNTRPHNLVGITTLDIPAGADGKIVHFGRVRQVNTTGSTNSQVWADGDVLYIDPVGVGKLTNVRPNLGEILIPVAMVILAHTSGTLMVRVSSIDGNDISDAVVASYYSKIQLDAGQLDNRYYTETEVDALLALQNEANEIVLAPVGNLTSTNVQSGLVELQVDIDTINSSKVSNIVAGNGIIVNDVDPVNPIVSTVPTSSAGILSRIYATGDTTVLTSGTYYLSSGTAGTVASVEQTVAVDDNAKAYFAQDYIGEAAIEDTTYYAGTYSGALTVATSDDTDQQRFTIEIYKTDVNGVVIDSGLAGEVIGDLGVKPMAVLSTGIIDILANNLVSVAIDGTLTEQAVILANQRIRFHVSGEKLGTVGGIATLSFYGGYDRSSYIDVPVAVTTDSVINKSTVTGATASDALEGLLSNINTKADIDSATLTGTPLAPTAAVSTNTTQIATTAFVNTEIANDTYSKVQLDAGQLDNRYYTETEVNSLLASQNEASEIAYSGTISGLVATNTQTAIDEVEGRVDTAESTLIDHQQQITDARAFSIEMAIALG